MSSSSKTHAIDSFSSPLLSSLLFSLHSLSSSPSPTQVGLDNAGKTSILYRLHLGETVSTTPTLGCNVERVVAPTTSSSTKSTTNGTSSGLEFEVWDLGGQANLRPSWAAYYKSSDAAILVVDCTDRARVGIARGELVSLLADDHLADAPLLVFANKQDARGPGPARGPAARLARAGVLRAERGGFRRWIAVARGEGREEEARERSWSCFRRESREERYNSRNNNRSASSSPGDTSGSSRGGDDGGSESVRERGREKRT